MTPDAPSPKDRPNEEPDSSVDDADYSWLEKAASMFTTEPVAAGTDRHDLELSMGLQEVVAGSPYRSVTSSNSNIRQITSAISSLARGEVNVEGTKTKVEVFPPSLTYQRTTSGSVVRQFELQLQGEEGAFWAVPDVRVHQNELTGELEIGARRNADGEAPPELPVEVFSRRVPLLVELSFGEECDPEVTDPSHPQAIIPALTRVSVEPRFTRQTLLEAVEHFEATAHKQDLDNRPDALPYSHLHTVISRTLRAHEFERISDLLSHDGDDPEAIALQNRDYRRAFGRRIGTIVGVERAEDDRQVVVDADGTRSGPYLFEVEALSKVHPETGDIDFSASYSQSFTVSLGLDELGRVNVTVL